MGTFFEKLTSAKTTTRPQATVLDSAPVKEDLQRVLRRREEEKTTHLKVEDEEEQKEPEEVGQEDEEEGELTVDIYDKGDSIVIQSTVAGVKPEDLDVSISNDTVVIKGKRERYEEIAEKDYFYKELFWGTFSRSVILPEEIDEDAAEAVLKNGLLTLRLPKKRRGVTQKLKVKVS